MCYKIVFHNTGLRPMTENQILSYDIDEDARVSKDNGTWQPLYTYPELNVEKVGTSIGKLLVGL